MVCRSSEKPKLKHRKGLWSPDEDQKLRDYVMNHGHGCWSAVPINAGLQRNGKSCRLRWINYLRPGLKRGVFTIQEEETILTLHGMLGNKWSQMSLHLPGRTDNEIKNYWHSYLKKKVSKVENLEVQPKSAAYTNSSMGSTETCMPVTRNLRVDSLDFMDGSSSEEGQFIPPSFDHPKGATQSNLPKVLFADWLGLEQFQGQEFSGSSDQNLVFGDDSCHGSNNTGMYIQNALLSNEGSINSSDNGLSTGNFYHTQVKSDPIFNFTCGGNYHYESFGVDNFMYI